MYTGKYIGEKPTHVKKILKPIKDKGPRKTFNESVKENFIIPHPDHSKQFSLNHNKMEEIESIINPSTPTFNTQIMSNLVNS